MNKQKKIATIMALTLLLISAGSVAAVLGQPSPELRATRIVEVAEDGSQKVKELIDSIYANETELEMIEAAGLFGAFEANETLYLDGVGKVEDAKLSLSNEDYDGAIANSTEALSIFREVYRSINTILFDSGIYIRPLLSVEVIQEAIVRSQERVNELKGLISEDATIYAKLVDAERFLIEATEYLNDNTEEAKNSLREANTLISEVCIYLRDIAREFNPQRLRDYCEGAFRYRERFRERFGQARMENFDMTGFLQGFGYQNEEEFMARFQEMIQNAQTTEDIHHSIEELEEIGRVIRQMDQTLTQEMGRHRAQHGQTGSMGGYGQEYNTDGFEQNSGFGESHGSGQMGFRGGQ